MQPSVVFIPEAHRKPLDWLLKGERDLELRSLQLCDFHHRPVLGLYARQHRQLMDIEKRLRAAGVDVYEGDVRPPERYMMERFITAPVWFGGTADASGTLLDAQMKPAPTTVLP